MKIRLRLRTLLLTITVLTLVGWHVAKVAIWVLRRPVYQILESYHRVEAEVVHNSWISERYHHKDASYWLHDLLINPELDVHKAAIGGYYPFFGPRSFWYPFLGPRSDWMDVMEKHQARIDQLAEEAAEHEWLSKWYKRAYATPWCEPPLREIGPLEKKWLEPRVPWWSMMGLAP